MAVLTSILFALKCLYIKLDTFNNHELRHYVLPDHICILLDYSNLRKTNTNRPSQMILYPPHTFSQRVIDPVPSSKYYVYKSNYHHSA